MLPTVRCLGCGGLVPDIDGPAHRYMLASPGCWAAYAGLLASPDLPVPAPFDALLVDAYAVQHPGVPGPQAIQSVWVHLIALHLVLERGWPTSRLIPLRRLSADGLSGRPWLDPPGPPHQVTAVDLASATGGEIPIVARRWVEAAWAAWAPHATEIRTTAAALVTRLDR